MSAAAPGGLTVDSFFRQLLESFACQLIGFTIGTTIYGITVLQTFIYFKRYPGDRRLLRITVVVLLILDTLGTILVAHSLYTYLVLNYRDPTKDINLIWSFSLENGTTTLITFIVQCYFAQCLWRFSGKNKYLVGTIIFFAVSSFGLGVGAR